MMLASLRTRTQTHEEDDRPLDCPSTHDLNFGADVGVQ